MSRGRPPRPGILPLYCSVLQCPKGYPMTTPNAVSQSNPASDKPALDSVTVKKFIVISALVDMIHTANHKACADIRDVSVLVSDPHGSSPGNPDPVEASLRLAEVTARGAGDRLEHTGHLFVELIREISELSKHIEQGARVALTVTDERAAMSASEREIELEVAGLASAFDDERCEHCRELLYVGRLMCRCSERECERECDLERERAESLKEQSTG